MSLLNYSYQHKLKELKHLNLRKRASFLFMPGTERTRDTSAKYLNHISSLHYVCNHNPTLQWVFTNVKTKQMKKPWIPFLIAFFLGSHLHSVAQETEKEYPVLSTDSITREGYTLIFINKDTALDATVKQRLLDAFFIVYPKEAATYNPNTSKKVTFIMDPAYDGVAATGDDVVRYNPEWFRKHPGDIDVVTHEVAHIVQAYGETDAPGWITEGIADYLRYRFGVDNTGAGWKLYDYSAKQNYDNSYRVTARFFVWIEQHYDKNFVKQLDDTMRRHTYKDDFAKKHTGKTFAGLWEEYGKNPAIE